MLEIIKALVLTILIEGVAIFLIKRTYKFVLYSIIINIITNLSLNLIVNNFVNSKLCIYIIVVTILEIIVLFVEAFLYNIKIKKYSKALLLSLILNMLSLGFGFLMYIPIE